MRRTLLLIAALSLAADWPQFRGPNGTGVAADTTVPVSFKEGDGIQWKVPLPGRGSSSPVVSRGKIFLQTASADGTERTVLCLDAVTGKTLWTKSVPGAKAPTHSMNTLASSTPAADGERVYFLFWDGKAVSLAAYDYDGKSLWSRPLGTFKSQHGLGTSPIVHEGRVFVHFDQDRLDPQKKTPIPGNEHACWVYAFDGVTGKQIWRAERKGHYTSYSVPILHDTATGTKELVVMGTPGITAYDPATGSVNWHWEWPWEEGDEVLRTVATPVFWKDVVYIHGGNGAGNSRISAVRAGAKGKEPALVWEKKRGQFSYVPTMLVSGEYLFTIYDKNGIAGCYEAGTGKPVWTHSLSGSYKASPVLIDGKVYMISEDGVVFVYPAAPTFKLLARNPLGETVRASPAVADGRLYVRGEKHLFCIGSTP